MLQQTTKHVVKKSKDFKAINFSFNASAHAFKIISDNLYSKPVEAIVRELSCNAVDSHKKAGREDKPFQVKLPNRMDNTFFIRDYGTGLTPQEIREVYTVVFKSDKTHTNDYVGCFGLGSKIPFSIVSQFSVESVSKGKKWIYSAFLDENRIPAIADISEGGFDTDEEDGVKISFSVPQDKVYDFVNAAKEVFPYFDLKPEIHGANVSFEEIEYSVFKEGLYGFRKHTDYNSKPLAIMGNVCYTIDNGSVGTLIPKELDLFFEVGELTPTPSREHLQYDERTKTVIIEKYNQFVKTFVDDTLKQINEADSLIEARIQLDFLRSQSFVTRKEEIDGRARWKDGPFERISNLTLPHKIRAFDSGSEMTSWHYKDMVCSRLLYFKGRFVIPDEKTGFIAKSRYASKIGKRHILLSSDNVERLEQINCLKFNVGFHDNYFIKSSELDKPPRDQLSSRPGMARGIFKVFKIGYGDRASSYWRDMQNGEKLDETVYYVFASRGRWNHTPDNVSMRPSRLSKVVVSLRAVGFSPIIVGVLPSAKKKIPKTWKSLNEIKPAVEWLLGDQKVERKLLTKYAKDHYDFLEDLTKDFLFDNNLVDSLKDPSLKRLIVSAKENPTTEAVSSLAILANLFGLDMQAKYDKIKEEISMLKEKYSILSRIDMYYIKDKEASQIYNFLNLIHEKEK